MIVHACADQVFIQCGDLGVWSVVWRGRTYHVFSYSVSHGLCTPSSSSIAHVWVKGRQRSCRRMGRGWSLQKKYKFSSACSYFPHLHHNVMAASSFALHISLAAWMVVLHLMGSTCSSILPALAAQEGESFLCTINAGLLIAKLLLENSMMTLIK